MTDGFSLSLTTVLKPTKKFLVDGEEFELLGVDHLTPEAESEVMALFARYSLLSRDLDNTIHVEKGTEIAERMKSTRFTILTKLTTMPKAVASKLPLSQQVKLMEAIEGEVSSDYDDELEESPSDEAIEG